MRRKQLVAIFAIAPAILLGIIILTRTVYGATPGSDGKEGKSAGHTPAAPSALNTQGYSASAYNSADTEFLVVFEDGRNENWDIYAQRVDADGTMLGSNFAIVASTGAEQETDVAYNSSAANEYLVVWNSYSDNKIYGQRVSATGPLAGTAFEISSGTAGKNSPTVDYSAGDNQYLVVWTEYISGQGSNIRGRRVASSGTLQGGVIDIAATNDSESRPALSY
ncbi:MAG: hypothetical protein M3328_06435, partial [Chloroflexota bacterium]|nr:hypothetical protein [Chloroflexota bacterium]